MNVDNYFDNIICDLINSGSVIPYADDLKKECNIEAKKDRGLLELLKSISFEIEYYSKNFLNEKNEYDISLITGLSTGIYIPSKDSGSLKYILVGGNRTRNSDEKVDFNTLFDVASITKLYTLLLIYKLEELGYINLDDKVSDINPDFKNLNEFSFNDLICLFGEFRTDGNIVGSTYDEALRKFKTLYVVSNDKTKIKYTDFGAMVLGDTIEKVVSKYFNCDMKLNEIMDIFLFKKFDINNTLFTPQTTNISGNGYGESLPHDPKSRAFCGISGHAGIFTNSSDLMKLSDLLFSDYINSRYIDRLSKNNVEGVHKGNLGLFLKHPDGYNITFNPMEYSCDSFTAQGWTGGISSFDLKNKIHNSILVNAIINEDKEKLINNKPKGFRESFNDYQMNVVKKIMLLYIMKEYYNNYCNDKSDVVLKKTL